MRRTSDLWSFILSFRKQWFAAMSGGVSVPFTALSVYADTKYGQSIFAIMAFVAIWFATFRVWKAERDKNLELESASFKNRLKYRLAVTAEVMDQFISGGKKLEGRIHIENTSDEPLEYGPAVFSASFQNEEPKTLNGREQILRPP